MFVFMKGEGREEKRIKKVKENGKGTENTYLDVVGKRNEKKKERKRVK